MKRRRRPGVAISCWRFLGVLVICFRSTARRQQLSAARRKWCRQRQPAWRPGTGRCCSQAAVAVAGQPLFQCSANGVPVRSAAPCPATVEPVAKLYGWRTFSGNSPACGTARTLWWPPPQPRPPTRKAR